MALAVTAREAVARVREYVQDSAGVRWIDSEILSALDQGFEDVQKAQRLSAQYYHLRRMDIPTSSWTRVKEFWHEYEDLPETVRHIEQVWGTRTGDEFDVPILEGEVYDIPRGHSAYQRGNLIWSFSGAAYPGTISIAGGGFDAFTAIRIWYLPRWPELHYTTSSGAGISVSTTTTADFPADSLLQGSVVPRDDVYNGLDVVFEDTQTRRRITDFDGANRRITFDAMSAPPTGQYSLVVPMAPEHTEYLMLSTAYIIAMRMGNNELLEALDGPLAYADRRFREALAARSHVNPRRVWSSRQ